MTGADQGTREPARVDASLKTQDEPIVETFARAEHRVLTTKEISSDVELSDRQVRRRLKDLASREIIETRKPGRDRLWWLKREVKEPITSQYPLLRFARDRTSVQLLLFGVSVGIIALVVVLSASLTYAYGVSPLWVTRATLLRWGLLASVFGGAFIVSSALAAVFGWTLRRLEFDLPL